MPVVEEPEDVYVLLATERGETHIYGVFENPSQAYFELGRVLAEQPDVAPVVRAAKLYRG